MDTPPSLAVPEAAIARLRLTAVGLTAALILLGIAWETFLAPLRPGGSLLVFKVLPLVLALPAFWKGRVRHYQLWSMLILAYLCEGVVRGMSDGGRSAILGWVETALALAIYLAIMRYVQLRRHAAGRAPESGIVG
ncbi:MAG: DUF2069 domain-containing protein [Lautropia sp.]|nr:DUF2069 domain-containing protein [Lautropia sp.]